MELAAAQRIIIETDGNTGKGDLLNALNEISSKVVKISLNSENYLLICRALLDKVAPCLLDSSKNYTEDSLALLENFFLDGNAAIAFTALCESLAVNSEITALAARTLVLFVSERTGGISRLTDVLMRANSREVATYLLHLPSRITNVLFSTLMEECDSSDLIDEKAYFGSIAEVIFKLPQTSDLQREALVKDIIARMVTLNHSDTIINRFLQLSDANRLVSILCAVPQQSIEVLTRSLLNAKVELRAQEKERNIALGLLMKRNRFARECCINTIPFRRPLLKRPKVALRSLVQAIVNSCQADTLVNALITASEVWSSEMFSLSEDILMQRQVTRLVLYYLRYITNSIASTDSASNSVMMVLVDGVHFRLDSSDVRVRRHGMIVGEASSKHYKEKKVLKFDREGMKQAQELDRKFIGDEFVEDGGDTDFSDVVELIGTPDCDLDEVADVGNGENGTTSENANTSLGAKVESPQREDSAQEPQSEQSSVLECKMQKRASDSCEYSRPTSTREQDWQAEDDWSTIDSYEMTSSSEDEINVSSNGARSRRQDYVELRKKLSAPMSVPRLLTLLRDVNKSDSGSTIIEVGTATAALRTLASRAEANFLEASTLKSAAVDLCMQIGRIDPERYPDVHVPELAEAREKAFKNVVEMDIGSCGVALVQRVICGTTSDITHRLEALTIIAKAVRSAYARVFNNVKGKVEESSPERKVVETFGVQTKYLAKSLTVWRERQNRQTRNPSPVKWHGNDVRRVFHCLASRLCEGGGASFIVIEGRDMQLWGHGLVTLATLACYSDPGMDGAQLRCEVLEIAVRRVGKLSAEAVVRRAIVLALSTVIGGMEDHEVKEILVGGVNEVVLFQDRDEAVEIGRETFEWLQGAADNDPDIGVRRFASIALRKWVQRVEPVLK